ncbi:beta-ketoacyl synthase N-terminal-like domain-containing protein [Micromonospora sp. NPDC050276]|uniref:beta-ketoacyl synthase N-terminal-like domain-containing protein n=1 Tax=Micromonospora sp. NPDC050276 TaxID=3364278 RepID=UPI00378B3370
MTDIGRVWVTGMAWRTALGSDLDDVWGMLLSGATGIDVVPSEHPVRNSRAATLADLPLHEPPTARLHALTRDTMLAALADAGISRTHPGLRPIVGTSYGPHLDMGDVSSLDQWCADVTGELGMPVPPIAVSTACSSGSDSLLVGAELIRAGVEQICLCGAADILTPSKRIGHSLLGTMSPTRLRAFDTRHDGTLLGEGSAFLVLESEAHARNRRARAHGYLLGAGSANDAVSSAAPDPSGVSVVRAVHRALRSAGRGPSDVGVVNAHGSGTVANDETEAASYRQIFAGQSVAPTVFATKGAFGHTLGATGALEAVAVLLALRGQRVPPVHGLEDVVPELTLPVPVGEPRTFVGDTGMSVTLGFGGFNTCVVFGAPT